MSARAGQLLWNRRRLTLDPGETIVDTRLTVVDKSYPVEQEGDTTINPPLGIEDADDPGNGSTPASRVMVIPLSPTAPWATIEHGEPWVDTDTNTVKVTFTNSSKEAEDIVVLFWCPHTSISPGQADTYQAPEIG